jgi:hypothetical protein
MTNKDFLAFGTRLFFIFPKDFACNGRYLWYNESIREKERKKMKKFYGSDDGYDYQKDNRNGEVDAYVAFVKEWRKEQAKKKAESPKE